MNHLLQPKIREFELEEISTWAVVHLEHSRGTLHIFRGEEDPDRSQFFTGGFDACLLGYTARVFILDGTGTSTADWEKVFENCTSIKGEEQFEVMSRIPEGVVSWERAEVFTVPKPTKEKTDWTCKLGHCISADELTQRINKQLQK